MRRLSIFTVLVSAAVVTAAAAYAAPLPGNGAYVTINNAPLYQDNPDKTLKYLEGLTLGDVVTLQNRTSSFKESGTNRDFLRVKGPDGKEGWVRAQFVAPKSSLAVVKNDGTIIFSEPRYVKATSRSASPMTVVAVLQDGSNKSFAHIQGYDVAKQALLVDQTYVSVDDLSTVDADVQAAILYAAAMDSKSPDVKKSLLKLASSKYGTSLWGGAIDLALNGGSAPASGTTPGSTTSSAAAPAPANAVPSKTLLDSGDVHVAYEAGTVQQFATTHNIVRLSRGGSTTNEYIDGLVTDITAEEDLLGQSKAVFIQSVAVDKDGRHGSVVVYGEDDNGFSKLGGPWDSPAGGKIVVLDAKKGEPWAPFKVTLPDTSSGSAYTAGAIYVTYDGDQNQYVSDDYTQYLVQTDDGFFKLNDDRINMRDSPSTSGKVLSTLSQDTPFHIFDRTGEMQTIGGKNGIWYKIVPKGSDKAGWIFGAFVEEQEMDEPK